MMVLEEEILLKKRITLIMFLCMIYISSLYTDVFAREDFFIANIPDVKIMALKGEALTLPSRVAANLSNGKKTLVDIKWSKSKVSTSKAGTFKFTGTVKDYAKKVNLSVIIKNEFDASDVSYAANSSVVYIEKFDRRGGLISLGSGFIVQSEAL